MIGALQGIVIKIASDYLLLDVRGVGYKIFCTTPLLADSYIGMTRFFYIETLVAEAYIKLYGFTTEAEKNWFLTLGLVQGVGAKAALSVLSSATLSQIMDAILFGDKTVFSKAAGVGVKLAERIVNELKTKKDLPPVFDTEGEVVSQSFVAQDNMVSPIVKNSAQNDAHEKRVIIENVASALMNLGYGRSDAMKSVLEVTEMIEDYTESNLIHAALQHIGKMKAMM